MNLAFRTLIRNHWGKYPFCGFSHLCQFRSRVSFNTYGSMTTSQPDHHLVVMLVPQLLINRIDAYGTSEGMCKLKLWPIPIAIMSDHRHDDLFLLSVVYNNSRFSIVILCLFFRRPCNCQMISIHRSRNNDKISFSSLIISVCV